MLRDRFHLREALAFALVTSCAPLLGSASTAAEGAAYKDELRRCRVANATCLGYVSCRKRVAAEHGETYSGRCEP